MDRGATDAVDKGLGAPEGEPEIVQKQLEKDLDFMEQEGRLVGKVLGPNSEVFPVESEKIYNVELRIVLWDTSLLK